MPEPLWKDDRPPTQLELEHYLTHVLGIPDDDAKKLVTAYSDHPGARRGQDSWTPESLSGYVDDLVAAWRRDQNNLRSEGGAESDAEAQARLTSAQTQVTRERDEDTQRDAEGRQQRDQAAQAVATIRESTYSRARARWVTDIDDQLDVAQSLASGVVVDADGNPVTDPQTGEPIQADAGTIFQAIKNFRFDMGALAFRGAQTPQERRTGQRGTVVVHPSADTMARTGQGRGGAVAHPSADTMARDPRRISDRTVIPPGIQPRRPGQYITPSQALNLLGSMSEDDLTALQQKMLDAGLYDMVADNADNALPTWGIADPLTRRAFMQLFVEASQRSGDTIDKVISDLQASHLSRSRQDGQGGSGPGGSMVVDIPAFEPKIMSAETLGQTIDDLAQDLIGQFVPEGQKQSLIAKMQERETAVQRQAYDQSVADIRAQAGQQASLATGGAGNDINAFMGAIAARESGGSYTARNRGSGAYGKYQIMPANWGPWAQRAGLPSNAPQTPENQEIVARTIMLDYYQKFGNWRDVAIAWFAGPGAVGRPGAESRSDGNMTVRAYANEVVNRMGQGRAMPGGVAETGGAIHAPIEEFDPQAELKAAIKAGDPLGFQAHEFADRAVQWFSLLGGMA